MTTAQAEKEPKKAQEAQISRLRPARLLIAALWGLLFWPLIYLVGANTWLATSAHSLAGRHPEKFQADWRLAYTLWPGRVFFRGLELRGRNAKLLWLASLEKGHGELSLPELLAREVRVESLRGNGFRLEIRPRDKEPESPGRGAPPPATPAPAAPAPATPAPSAPTKTSAEPPIANPKLPPMPYFEGLSEPRPSGKRPWTITIEDFSVDDIAEIWLERYHFIADGAGGRLMGSLDLNLRRSASLPSFLLELGRGQLTIADHQLAQVESLKLRGALSPFLTRRYHLTDFSRYLDAELEVDAKNSDLSPLEYYLRGSPIELRGQGRLNAHLFLQHGVLGAGSRLDVKEAKLELAYLNYWGRGQGGVQIAVASEKGQDRARLDAKLEKFELGVAGAETAHLRGKGLTVWAETASLDLADPRPELSGEVRLPETEIPDFKVYRGLWPDSFPLELLGGQAKIESSLRFKTLESSHEAEGEIEVVGQSIRAKLLGNQLTGNFRFKANLFSQDLLEKTFDVRRARLEIRDLQGNWQPPTRNWWANFDIPSGRLRLEAPRTFELDLVAKLADTSPLVAALLTKKPSFDWLSKILTVSDLRLQTGVALRGKSFELHRLNLQGGSHLEIHGELRLENKQADGAFHLEYGPLATAVRLLPAGERDWKIFHSQETYDAWIADLRRRRDH